MISVMESKNENLLTNPYSGDRPDCDRDYSSSSNARRETPSGILKHDLQLRCNGIPRASHTDTDTASRSDRSSSKITIQIVFAGLIAPAFASESLKALVGRRDK